MSILSRISITFASLMGVSASAFALAPGDAVENFRLIDQQGGSHELYYLSDMKAVVLIAHGNSCKASASAEKALAALKQQYQGQPVEFLAIDSNLGDTREAVEKDLKDTGIDLPVLNDPLQLIGESMNLAHNGEVLVIDPKNNWHLAYRGEASSIRENYAADALAA